MLPRYLPMGNPGQQKLDCSLWLCRSKDCHVKLIHLRPGCFVLAQLRWFYHGIAFTIFNYALWLTRQNPKCLCFIPTTSTSTEESGEQFKKVRSACFLSLNFLNTHRFAPTHTHTPSIFRLDLNMHVAQADGTYFSMGWGCQEEGGYVQPTHLCGVCRW